MLPLYDGRIYFTEEDFLHSRLTYLVPVCMVLMILPVALFSGTEILWDSWGVPHIYADDWNGMFYAYGWAQMESRGNLVLKLYGQARGRAAEYWGDDYLEEDRIVHTMGVPERASRWFEAQTPEWKERIEAFVRGMNAFAEMHPDDIEEAMRLVLPVTVEDVMAHIQRTYHLQFIGGRDLYRSRQWEGSNAWAIGPSKSESGHAMLLYNPHLYWEGDVIWYESHLNAPGVSIYGAAMVGMPWITMGFNEHLGYSNTVNTMDGADLYELVVKEEGYIIDGEVRSFETEERTIRVKEEGGSHREEKLMVRRSVHGPVVRFGEEKALALRLVGLDQPFIIEQNWEMARATNREEFEAAFRRLQIPFLNFVYADRDGHIMYIFGGRIPKRASGDWAFWQGVVPGDDSSTLWSETHGFDDLPKVVDPVSGWVQNTNDPPWRATLPMVLNPEDYPSAMGPEWLHLRAQRSLRMLSESEQLSYDDVLTMITSTRIEMADRILDDLMPVLKSSEEDILVQASDVLNDWDREADADSRGSVLFLAWIREMGRSLFAESWNAENPMGSPDGLAIPDSAKSAMRRVAANLMSTYGTLDVPYGAVYRLRHGGKDIAASGASGGLGCFYVLGFQPRGGDAFQAVFGTTFLAAVEFSDPLNAKAVMSYGNAAPESGLYIDQQGLISSKQLRDVWLTREEILDHLLKRKGFEY